MAKKFFACLVGLLLPCSAVAAPAVSLDSAVYVERTSSESRVLEPAARLEPGDRVVTVVTWRRNVAGGQFVLTNPLPRGLWYQGSAMEDEEVSVDGGRNWGRLGTLKVTGHAATPEDVTHVRWRIASPGASGRIAYSAIVRR